MFSGPHYPLTWSNGFCRGRGKNGALVEKGKGPWQRGHHYDNFLIIFFGGRENEGKRRQENAQT